MGFLKKLFGLPDENDFDSMYQVRCDYNSDNEALNNDAAQSENYTAADSYTYANEGNFMFTVEDVFNGKEGKDSRFAFKPGLSPSSSITNTVGE